MQNTLEIRLNILKYEGMGLSKTETVKAIAEKLGCSKSDIYWHYSTRPKWQRDFLDYTDRAGFFDMAVSRLNYIYREATFQYFRADNSSAKCGFLRLMLEDTLHLKDLVQAAEVEELKQAIEEIKREVAKKH
jgi:AcrR family transcriptional regulator